MLLVSPDLQGHQRVPGDFVVAAEVLWRNKNDGKHWEIIYIYICICIYIYTYIYIYIYMHVLSLVVHAVETGRKRT